MSPSAARAGDALLHPVPLLAVGVLLLSDHVLKYTHPGFLTGKLSDVAGMVFFPLLLVAVTGLLAPRWDRRRVLLAALVSTGVVFALVQVWPLATEAYRWGLGALQWPFYALVAALRGAPTPPVAPVYAFADPTDLVALPALAISWWVGADHSSRTDEVSLHSPVSSD